MKTNSCFTKKCAPKEYADSEIWYFYCNRAGTYNPRGLGKRQLKSQGTNRIGKQCTAHIHVTINLSTKAVSIKYCATHHGHVTKLGHLPIPSVKSLNIAAKVFLWTGY